MAQYRYRLSKNALKQLKKLNPQIRRRIVEKMDWFCEQELPFRLAKRLVDSELGEYRLRIGNWRVVFDVDEKRLVFKILLIDHRKDIYR